MYKTKFSCYQKSSEKSFQQGFEAAPYKGITNGIKVKRKLRDYKTAQKRNKTLVIFSEL